MMLAVIFDFDGLILETEEPTYKSWQEIYQSFGFSLPFSTWEIMVGTTQSDFNPRLELEKLVGKALDWDLLEARRQVSENAHIELQPVLPGARQYLQDARCLGLKVGLASNSSTSWVTRHLTRIGLFNCFDCIRTSTDVPDLKPSPALYLSALQGLGVQAGEAFALEDSPLGIRSAKAAGLLCVAVPNVLTSRLDLSQADFRVESLEEMPFEELVNKIQEIKTQRAAL